MGHMIDMSNNQANVAFVGETPWHGLGQKLTPNQPLEIWAKEAGLNWIAVEHPLFLATTPTDDNGLERLNGYKCMKRSDTGMTLAVLKSGYKVVQPMEVLDFHRSLIEKMGFTMETAGVLMGGKRVWALARTGEELTLMGQDKVNGYVLVATSFDGSMATVVSRTSVRVVCWNTLQLSVGADGKRADVRIPHIAHFNADMIKGRLGLETNEVWAMFNDQALAMAERKVTREEAVRFILSTFYPNVDQDADLLMVDKPMEKKVASIINLFEHGVGQNTRSAQGTAWGLVNAVTRWSDHVRGTHTIDARLNRAWFGDSATIKARAFGEALKLVA